MPKTDEEILVFGSNLSGAHGWGAALIARKRFNAQLGVSSGRTGNAYAIPTKGRMKNKYLPTLSLKEIRKSVREFREHTKRNKHEIYFVTRVACGLAGYKDSEIAPMFRGAT
ncbi:MAG: hypothetical protein ABWX90_03855, partial [Candidatus Saccharimonadales bacterium]